MSNDVFKKKKNTTTPLFILRWIFKFASDGHSQRPVGHHGSVLAATAIGCRHE